MLMLPALTGAQNFQNMSEADMQNMMQQAEKMQTCGKMMEGMMPGMPTVLQDDPGENDNWHICDN